MKVMALARLGEHTLMRTFAYGAQRIVRNERKGCQGLSSVCRVAEDPDVGVYLTPSSGRVHDDGAALHGHGLLDLGELVGLEGDTYVT